MGDPNTDILDQNELVDTFGEVSAIHGQATRLREVVKRNRGNQKLKDDARELQVSAAYMKSLLRRALIARARGDR